ncbi:MAG: GldG family protein [Oscillospiraceae bacterium]|jgi:ABC-2 type transport system permease protein|nr:GldG family protein [Oscillospiraceae bacterium]
MDNKITDTEVQSERVQVKGRKLKYGTLAAVFTAVFIVAVVAVNVFVGYFTDRFVLEIDLTAEKMFEISNETKQIIADLDPNNPNDHITITVLAEETSYQNAASLLGAIYELLQRYEALGGGKITVRYVDPIVNPGVMDSYDDLRSVASTNDIIVESPLRYKRFIPNNFYAPKIDANGQTVTNSDGTVYNVGLRAEQRIGSAILYVTNDIVAKAAWIRGHDEMYSITEFDTLLSYANYEPTTIILAQEDIPADTELLIINEPKSDYSNAEIDKISAFLDNGGDLIVAMTPDGMRTPNLDLFFEEWGVRYTGNIIYDSKQSLSGFPQYVVPSIVTYTNITSNLPRQYAMMPASRAIELTSSQKSNITVQPLMRSSGSSYAKPFEEAIQGFTQTAGDPVGPFNMTVLSERLVGDKSGLPIRSDVFFTNGGLTNKDALEEKSFLNSAYLGATLEYISEYADGLLIEDKEFVSMALTLLQWQGNLILWLFVIAIPAILIAAGIIVWARRKNR